MQTYALYFVQTMPFGRRPRLKRSETGGLVAREPPFACCVKRAGVYTFFYFALGHGSSSLIKALKNHPKVASTEVGLRATSELIQTASIGSVHSFLRPRIMNRPANSKPTCGMSAPSISGTEDAAATVRVPPKPCHPPELL